MYRSGSSVSYCRTHYTRWQEVGTRSGHCVSGQGGPYTTEHKDHIWHRPTIVGGTSLWVDSRLNTEVGSIYTIRTKSREKRVQYEVGLRTDPRVYVGTTCPYEKSD